jgi:uncharacterized protein (TIGR02300 family)
MEAARKARLGERWICFSCAGKFYDLNKPDPLCPKCGTNQRESPVFKQKKPKRPKKSGEPVIEEEPEETIEPAEEPVDTELDALPDEDDAAPPGELEIEDLDMAEEEEEEAALDVDED